MKPDEIFYYRVCPKNGVGFGACSANFTFLSDTYPKFMFPPVSTPAQVYPKWIFLTWSPITTDLQNGRDPAIFYDLQYDKGSNQVSWESLIDESAGMLTSFNHSIATVFPDN